MQSIYDQIIAFAVTIAIGFLAGILFDVYRIIRGLWQPKRIGTFIGDVIFWFIMTCLVFILLLLGNWGELRIYVFIGITTGYFLYLKYFSKKVQRLIRKIFIFTFKLFRYLWTGFIWPFKIIYRVLLIPVGIIAAGFAGINKTIKNIYIKSFKKCKRRIKKILNRKPEDKN